ncbi:hypothetical protein FS749_000401 [Ceratobasidium sp. UAMH 11750]|nr:hypothetical protein FS749_000401 [Ceratobasidium sp. UAMH 11750]
MSKSSIAMWEAAQRNEPRLPECPTTMSLPQYAALAFMNECSLCGECTPGIKLELKLRVRLCKSCRSSELVDIYGIKDYNDLFLVGNLSLTLKDPTTSSKRMGHDAMAMGTDHTPHCLRRDLKAFYDTREEFIRSGDRDGLEFWELKLQHFVRVHDQFSELLRRFLIHPKLTPMQKSWQKAGERVDRIPHPDETFTFNNVGVNPDGDDTDGDQDIGEDDEVDEEQGNTEDYNHDRHHLVHAELQRVKPLVHPFKTVLEALGVGKDKFLVPGSSIPCPSEDLKDYPFPTTVTVLSWPCFSTFHQLYPSQVAGRFWSELGHIIHHVDAWRENGEQELVEWWKLGTEPTGNLTNLVVKIRASTAATENLPPNLRLLLRADTVFSYKAPGTPGGQSAHLHYPHFYPNPDECPAQGSPRSMNSTRMYRHLEAERVTKALLRDLEMPDVAYIQLLLIGASLVCGRCDDSQPRTWNQIIDHYLQEAQLWTELQSRASDFKTERPVKFTNIHNLNSISSAKPFVRRLTTQEVASLINSPPLDVNEGFCCIPCRNYQVCHPFKDVAPVWTHMNDVHGIVNPTPGLHYTSRASTANFSNWGNKWCDSWDAQQEARE